jgi:hypothetical protein
LTLSLSAYTSARHSNAHWRKFPVLPARAKPGGVQNAITTLHAANSAADAATRARELQTQLLGAAQESFSAGYSTNISVIEQQTYLTQVQTTEVMAKAAWLKAAAQLDRVLGQTLEKSGISLKRDQVQDGSWQH